MAYSRNTALLWTPSMYITTQYTWMAREVISYYNNNGSDVYVCLLDCSKAFDHIRHDMLLQKLMSTDLPPIIIRSLMYM